MDFAAIFDFNGVIVDDEPLHYEAFRRTLAVRGLELRREDYYRRYIPLDDVSFFRAALRDFGQPCDEGAIHDQVLRKGRIYQELILGGAASFDGVVPLIRELSAAGDCGLAIASGALRAEIAHFLAAFGIPGTFDAIVAAEDVSRGKPHPECFLQALERINRARGAALEPSRCVVIEDSPAGLAGARAAGMRSVGVAHSVPAAALSDADLVLPHVRELQAARLRALLPS